MVGNMHAAQRAVAGGLPHLSGSGSVRDVYIDERARVVYKVERTSEPGHNDAEAIYLEYFSTVQLPPGVRLPNWSVYPVAGPDWPTRVIAMDFIDGQPAGVCCLLFDEDATECYCGDVLRIPDDIRDQLFALGLTEEANAGLGNILECNGEFFLIDLDCVHECPDPEVSERVENALAAAEKAKLMWHAEQARSPNRTRRRYWFEDP